MTSETKGKSLQDFRDKHDKSYIIPKKIRETLKELGNSWMYEAEFIRAAGISNSDMGTYRSEFDEDHVVVVERTKRVWCGTKQLADKLREMAT